MRVAAWALALVLALPAVAAAQAEAPAEGAPAESAAAEAGEGEEAEPAAEAEEVAIDPEQMLRDMLARVRAAAAAERAEDAAREAKFRQALEEQQRLLDATRAKVAREEAASRALDERYGNNELEIEELGVRLAERLGQMGELFGVVRLVATDLGAQTWDSITSADVSGRGPLLERLGRGKELPSTRDMEALWFELQREMTEQGRIVRFDASVLGPDDGERSIEVVRAGPYAAVYEGGYLKWAKNEQKLRVLERQPPGEYTGTARDYWSANGDGRGFRTLAVDPSRGVLMEALTDTPSLVERIHQGGYVGYTAILLGLVALGIGLLRFVDLWWTGRRVEAQLHSASASDDNPLGRLRAVYEANRNRDPETLELKLNEAILRETGGIERWLWVVQTVSIVAPLLGLLGTVTGMIQTFQAITLFGAGDPKVMAKGISEALVTTTLGLVIAIPLVLLYALLASRSRGLVETLDENSTAMVADTLERRRVQA